MERLGLLDYRKVCKKDSCYKFIIQEKDDTDELASKFNKHNIVTLFVTQSDIDGRNSKYGFLLTNAIVEYNTIHAGDDIILSGDEIIILETVDLNDEVIFISISELRKQNVDGGLLI